MRTMFPVVHFEMPAKDQKRMIDFYAKAFGWTANQLGADMGDYAVVMTNEAGKDGFPKKPGQINGGFYKRTKDGHDQVPSVVIAVDDIKKHVQIVQDAGGELLGEIQEIPGVGHYASFRDTEGNRVSMMQPFMGVPPDRKDA